MGSYDSIIKWKSHIYDDFLTNPKVVRYSIISSLITFISALIIGYIVAQFDPDGYNIFDNYISDMGSFEHTPLPYFLDYGAIITSILIIPAIYHIEQKLAPNPIEMAKFERMRFRLSGLGCFFMFFGFFGFFMVGVFSEDRTTSLGLHFLFSHVVFSGIVFSSLFYGLLILFYKTEIPRLLGLYMIIFPFTSGVLMLMYYTPFYEWIMLFSLLIWMIPVFLILLKDLKNE